MASKKSARMADKSEIIEEFGAKPPEDGDSDQGDLMKVDIERAKELGGIDPESIQANRRAQEAVNRKKGGEPGVILDDPNVTSKYEDVLKCWPLNTITILVNRLTGSAMTWTITSQPKNGIALYNELKTIHGRREETTYEVIFRDVYKTEYRGRGRITMPSTLDEPLPAGAGQVMPPQQGFAPPPQQMFAQPQQQQPVVVSQPQGSDPVAVMRATLEMMQAWQQQQNAGAPPAPVPVPAPAPPVVVSQNPDMAAMMQMMQMMRSMMTPQQQQPSPPPPQMPVPVPVPVPTAAPSPDMSAMMGMMKDMFEMVRSMQPPPPPPNPVRPLPPPDDYDRPVYRGPRPYSAPYAPYAPPPPQPPKSPMQAFAEATTVLQAASEMVDRFRPPAPQQQQQPQQEVYEREEDDSPVRVLEFGGNRILVNKDSGQFRPWETTFANFDKIMGAVKDMYDSVQKNRSAEQQQQQPQQQQTALRLPPGYVEVGPGYVPPEGFVAVPVAIPADQVQVPLPAPPTNLPPPINAAPQQQPQQPAWGMPTMPGEEQS